MLRIREWQGKWQVVRHKKYGHIEVICTMSSKKIARAYIQCAGNPKLMEQYVNAETA